MNPDDAQVLSDLHQGLRDKVQKMGCTTLPPSLVVPGSSFEAWVLQGWGCTSGAGPGCTLDALAAREGCRCPAPPPPPPLQGGIAL